MTPIGRFIEWLLSFLPGRPPIGRAAMEQWMESVIRIAKVPDNRSTRFALSVMMMHTDAEKAHRGKRYFVRQLIKGCAQEVAHAFIVEEKEKQKAEATDQAQPKTSVEATTDNPVGASEGQS